MSELHDFQVIRTMTVTWSVTIPAVDADAAEALANELPEPELCYGCGSPEVGDAVPGAKDPDLSLDGQWEVYQVTDEGPSSFVPACDECGCECADECPCADEECQECGCGEDEEEEDE